MNNFYDRLPLEKAETVERLARALYEAREYRTALLAQYQATSEADLLNQVRQLLQQEENEHPLYEHYLAARILDATRQALRRQIDALLRDLETADDDDLIHFHLLKALSEHTEWFSQPPELLQDSLRLQLNGGTTLTVHYAAADAYSLRWQTADDQTGGIDTAPGHSGYDRQTPSRLHLADGGTAADTLTSPQYTPEQNVRAVIEYLLAQQR